MSTIKFEEYYLADEVAKFFDVKTIAIIKKIKTNNTFKGKWIYDNKVYYIEKDIIDEIMYQREISMTIKESSKVLKKSIDTIRRKISDGQIYYFVDPWHNGKYRIYKEDIEQMLINSTDFLTVNDLAEMFAITGSNIRKKIKNNYCNINNFIKYFDNKKIYIKKSFLNHLVELERESTFIDEVARDKSVNKLDYTQKEIINSCLIIDKDSIFRDFVTANFKLKNELLNKIRNGEVNINLKKQSDFSELQPLLWQLVMTEEQFKKFIFIKFNINLDKEIKIINNKKHILNQVQEIILEKLKIYFYNKYNLEDTSLLNNLSFPEYMDVESIQEKFKVPSATLSKRIRNNYCEVQSYKKKESKKTLINNKFFHYLRDKNNNSILLKYASKDIKVTQSKLIIESMNINKDQIFKDFFTGELRISLKCYKLIKEKQMKIKEDEKERILLENKKRQAQISLLKAAKEKN